MRPLYASDPRAMALYGAVGVVWIAFEAWNFFRFHTVLGTREPDRDRLSGPALVGSLLLGIYLGSVLARLVPQAAIFWARPWLFALGLAMAVAGIVLRWYAIATLGRFFTLRVTTRFDQTVVEAGPYRLVRHPSYTGTLVTVLGFLLCSTNWVSLLCFLLVVPGFGYRIRVEEHALAEALGQPYHDYMRRTKRLIPYVL